tara:strand:+ start:1121 stop:1900 length:780 start_codon:yes stop_codon:yes gene_type:complete
MYLCNRLYQINQFYRSPLLNHNISIDWFLLIDNLEYKPTPFEDSYVRLMRWIGIEPTETVRLNDFRSDLITGENATLKVLLKNTAAHDAHLSQDFWKLLFLDFAGVRWVVRGSELILLEKNERSVSSIFNLRLPLYFYIDVLKNEEGQKIYTNQANDVITKNNYCLIDLFDESPFKIIMALFKAIKTPKVLFDEVEDIGINSPSEFTNASMKSKVMWAYLLLKQHIWNTPTDDSHNLVDQPIVNLYEKTYIPENWREYI